MAMNFFIPTFSSLPYGAASPSRMEVWQDHAHIYYSGVSVCDPCPKSWAPVRITLEHHCCDGPSQAMTLTWSFKKDRGKAFDASAECQTRKVYTWDVKSIVTLQWQAGAQELRTHDCEGNQFITYDLIEWQNELGFAYDNAVILDNFTGTDVRSLKWWDFIDTTYCDDEPTEPCPPEYQDGCPPGYLPTIDENGCIIACTIEDPPEEVIYPPSSASIRYVMRVRTLYQRGVQFTTNCQEFDPSLYPTSWVQVIDTGLLPIDSAPFPEFSYTTGTSASGAFPTASCSAIGRSVTSLVRIGSSFGEYRHEQTWFARCNDCTEAFLNERYQEGELIIYNQDGEIDRISLDPGPLPDWPSPGASSVPRPPDYECNITLITVSATLFRLDVAGIPLSRVKVGGTYRGLCEDWNPAGLEGFINDLIESELLNGASLGPIGIKVTKGAPCPCP